MAEIVVNHTNTHDYHSKIRTTFFQKVPKRKSQIDCELFECIDVPLNGLAS